MENNRNPEFFDDEEFTLAPIDAPEEVETETEEVETEEPEVEEEFKEEKVTETEVETVTEDDDNIFKINYDLLKEAGVLALPDDYTFDPSEDGLRKAVEESKEGLKNQLLEELTSQLPSTGVEILQFMLDTGSQNINEYLAMKAEPKFETLEVAEDDTDTQEQLMRVYLQSTTKFSEDKIEKEITKYKLDNDLYSRATEAKDELAEMQKQREAEFLEAEKQNKIERETQLKEATKVFSSTISSSTDINGIPFSKDEATVLTDSVFKPIKTKSGQITTRFNLKLEEALSDPKKTAILAKILEKDFNFDFIQKTTTTKVTKNLQEKLDRAVQAKKGVTVKTKGGFDWDSVTLVPNKK